MSCRGMTTARSFACLLCSCQRHLSAFGSTSSLRSHHGDTRTTPHSPPQASPPTPSKGGFSRTYTSQHLQISSALLSGLLFIPRCSATHQALHWSAQHSWASWRQRRQRTLLRSYCRTYGPSPPTCGRLPAPPVAPTNQHHCAAISAQWQLATHSPSFMTRVMSLELEHQRYVDVACFE